uniref:Cyclic nucleotide-gated ion channel 1-like n=1 Tax=Tanacetum cinerariifolium TaxID=118510 RepID=A0A6L2K0U6_TANCI|nr:cyclic nucleotide-gated ion channel 1-like [Tanacetum cinerariifolium]
MNYGFLVHQGLGFGLWFRIQSPSENLISTEVTSLEKTRVEEASPSTISFHAYKLTTCDEEHFRFYSQQWRTWAACYIQHAWRKHCKRKLGKLLEEENRRLQEALATGREASTLSVGAAIYVSRFSSNTLYILRQKHMHYEQVSTPKFELSLTKPAQPYFDDGEFSP